MILNFVGTEHLPFSEVNAHRRKNSDELVRSGLVALSSIVVGDVIVLPSVRRLMAKARYRLSSLYRHGTFPEAVSMITGSKLLETSGMVAVANAASAVPLRKYVKPDGSAASESMQWDWVGEGGFIKAQARRKDALTEAQIRSALIETSLIVKAGEVAILPSIHDLKDQIGTGFAGVYHNGLSYPQAIETVTGLTMLQTRYLALPSGTYLEHASNVLNADGTQKQNTQTQKSLELMG